MVKEWNKSFTLRVRCQCFPFEGLNRQIISYPTVPEIIKTFPCRLKDNQLFVYFTINDQMFTLWLNHIMVKQCMLKSHYHHHCSVLFIFQRKYSKVLSVSCGTMFQGFNAVCKVLYWLTRSNRFLGGSVLKFKSAVVCVKFLESGRLFPIYRNSVQKLTLHFDKLIEA